MPIRFEELTYNLFGGWASITIKVVFYHTVIKWRWTYDVSINNAKTQLPLFQYIQQHISPLGALMKDLGEPITALGAALLDAETLGAETLGTGRLGLGRPEPEMEEVTAIPTEAAAAPRNPYCFTWKERERESEKNNTLAKSS